MVDSLAACVAQRQMRYTESDHTVWDMLVEKILSCILGGRFDPRLLANVRVLGMIGKGIPSLDTLNEKLLAATGWQLDPVAEYGSEEAFVGFAQQKFPALKNIRPLSQIDRAEAPDLFHDYWGHPWMLLDRFLAKVYEEFGRQSILVADTLDFLPLARLYTNVIEFGLQRYEGRVVGFGAALASSPEELDNALRRSKPPLRIRFDPKCRADVLRAMLTDIHFDKLQETYFVLTDWQALMSLLLSDLTPYYQSLIGRPILAPGECHESDVLVTM